MEIEANGAQDAKNISEQAAAIRSLKTNLCLAILFAIPLILLIKFKEDIQMTFSLSLLASIQKANSINPFDRHVLTIPQSQE